MTTQSKWLLSKAEVLLREAIAAGDVSHDWKMEAQVIARGIETELNLAQEAALKSQRSVEAAKQRIRDKVKAELVAKRKPQ